ncbi:MAG: GTP pyrophosphokinase family protein [Ruminococcaceae bacterium]|nr:GTP pyrophosphokinase family protein [Oscillospiraceae bacterium]
MGKISKNGLDASKTDIAFIAQHAELAEQFTGLLELTQIYNSAIKEISTKLEILNDQFKIKHSHNPIRYIESRVKSPRSIIEKCRRKNIELNPADVVENVFDIAGIRVICCYIDDIYSVADMLLSQNDITLIRKKDYIKSPKENGYRSLHLVIRIPIFLADRVEMVPAEIQIRTVAMDFWASLEHQLRYKSKSGYITEGISRELKECAEDSAELDLRMQDIYRRLNSQI